MCDFKSLFYARPPAMSKSRSQCILPAIYKFYDSLRKDAQIWK